MENNNADGKQHKMQTALAKHSTFERETQKRSTVKTNAYRKGEIINLSESYTARNRPFSTYVELAVEWKSNIRI